MPPPACLLDAALRRCHRQPAACAWPPPAAKPRCRAAVARAPWPLRGRHGRAPAPSRLRSALAFKSRPRGLPRLALAHPPPPAGLPHPLRAAPPPSVRPAAATLGLAAAARLLAPRGGQPDAEGEGVGGGGVGGQGWAGERAWGIRWQANWAVFWAARPISRKNTKIHKIFSVFSFLLNIHTCIHYIYLIF